MKTRLNYEEILQLYKKVLEKAKTSTLEELTEFFGVKVADAIKLNIQYNNDLKFGWFKVVKNTDFNQFTKAAVSFLENETAGCIVIILPDGNCHVKNESGHSFGIFTEEYFDRCENSDFHVHAKITGYDGRERDTILYFKFSQEEYLMQVN